jgi:hypothetical protein
MKLARVCTYGCGLLLLALAATAGLSAQPTAVAPEIDGGSIASGLGLLAASVMILRARGRSKTQVL